MSGARAKSNIGPRASVGFGAGYGGLRQKAIAVHYPHLPICNERKGDSSPQFVS